MKRIDTLSFVIESNMIEGIWNQPAGALEKEVSETDRFLALDELTVPAIEMLARTYQVDARLRISEGMNVYVENYTPPSGGMAILYRLEELLTRVNNKKISPYEAHCEYECLHPLTDGNGRSGRVIWFWMMIKQEKAVPWPFLHTWYYQSLDFYRPL